MLSRRSVVAGLLAGVPALAAMRAAAETPAKDPLRMAYHHDVPPYSFVDEKTGKMRGILVDLMDIVGAASGYPMTHEGFPWARAQRMVATGAADALACPVTAERAEYVDFAPTPVTYLAEAEIFFTVDNPQADAIRAVHSKKGLYRFNVVDFIGNSSGDHIWRDHPQRKTARDIEQIVGMLLRGNADFYYADPLVTRFKLRNLGVLNRFTSVPADYVTKGHRGSMQFGLRKTYPDAEAIVALVDETIRRAITSQTRESVLARYTT